MFGAASRIEKMAGTKENIVRFSEILRSSKITLVNFLSVPPLLIILAFAPSFENISAIRFVTGEMAPRDPSRKLALGKDAYSFTCSCLFAGFFSTFAILANIGHCGDCRLAVMLSVSVFRHVRLPSFCRRVRCLEMNRIWIG